MITSNLISNSISPLHITDTGEEALAAMREYNVGQLPVIDGNAYAGVITIEDILGFKNPNHPISNFPNVLRKAFVLESAHIFYVMRAAVEFNVRVVPVVTEEHEYVGLITAETCLKVFATMNSITDDGGILELEIPIKDYRMSDVVRIAEESGMEILCFYTNLNPETHLMELTIKMNSTELSKLLAGLERHGYTIRAIHNDTDYTEHLKERYDSFMRYLNV